MATEGDARAPAQLQGGDPVSVFPATYAYPPAEVTDTREIALASVDPVTGERGEIWRFRLDPQVGIQPVLTGLFPPAISIGDAGRDNQPFASTDSHDDFTAGVGVNVSTTETSRGRYWWGTVDTRRKRDVTLLPLKVDHGNPHGGDPLTPITCGVDFRAQQRVLVAVGRYLYSYNPGAGAWTTATGTPLFTMAAAPTSDPVLWGPNVYFFTGNKITRYNGSAFVEIVNDAVAGVVYNGQMWLIDAAGAVEKTSSFDLTPTTAVSTVAFTDDTPRGMTTYLNADGLVVPYIIGRRRLHAIDPATGAIYPTGPALPPHYFPISASEGGFDRNMYIAQAMSVLQWGGNLAQDIGLTQDDGVPVQANGSIVKILGTERDLFALITRLQDQTGDVTGTGGLAEGFADFEVAERPLAYSLVMERTGSGWHPIAVADADTDAATALWTSYDDDHYRLWFCWGNRVRSIRLEYGFANPSEMLTPTEREPIGYLQTPWQDFTYKEEEKVVLLVSLRARFPQGNLDQAQPATIYPYVAWDDNPREWEELRPGSGTFFGVSETGRTDILIHADPYPPFNDQPAAGRKASNLRLRFNFERGSDPLATPRLIAYTIHALKVTPALMGWAAVLDMTDEWRGRSPDQQWHGFLGLLAANEVGLLHYAYTNAEDGTPGDLWPVKITGVTGVQNTGPNSAGKLRVSFSEVTHAAR